jgi:cytochrome b subunit of formate dehydrogenase
VNAGGMQALGWALIVVGVVIAVTGIVMVAGPRIPLIGHLPGDIVIQRENVTIYIPLGTMLLVSVIVSVVLALLNRR